MDRETMADHSRFILELLEDHYGGEGWANPGLVQVVEDHVDCHLGGWNWRMFDHLGEEYGIAVRLIADKFDPREAL